MENKEQKSESQIKQTVYMILDTSYFIKLRPLDLVNNNKYITTQYIINEIKDVHARDFYNLNKDFIEISNPSKDSMKAVSSFAKASNDLSYLSVADLSIIALAYETINKIGKGDLILKKPSEYQIVLKDKVKEKIQKEEKKKEEAFKDDGFSKEEEDDEGEWITPENIDSKLSHIENETKPEIKTGGIADNKINVYVNSGDFTLQNVCLKMGMPVKGVDGMQIRKIKNYILKCTTCNEFIFDTSKKFCTYCGYPYLMKIGYNVYSNGDVKINDKKPDIRKRGTQFELPKPSIKKNAKIYILAEDQMPKQKGKDEVNVDKILEYYENMKEIPKLDTTERYKSSKEYVWGYPKQNPNKAKKYYHKKK